MDGFKAICSAGSLSAELDDTEAIARFPHRWTEGGVSVSASFTGAHLLHAAVAGCVLNDLYREAAVLGIHLDGARVWAEGGFDENWASTGVTYGVELDSPADAESVERLLVVVDEVAEIPRAVRAGATVRRIA